MRDKQVRVMSTMRGREYISTVEGKSALLRRSPSFGNRVAVDFEKAVLILAPLLLLYR